MLAEFVEISISGWHTASVSAKPLGAGQLCFAEENHINGAQDSVEIKSLGPRFGTKTARPKAYNTIRLVRPNCLARLIAVFEGTACLAVADFCCCWVFGGRT